MLEQLLKLLVEGEDALKHLQLNLDDPHSKEVLEKFMSQLPDMKPILLNGITKEERKIEIKKKLKKAEILLKRHDELLIKENNSLDLKTEDLRKIRLILRKIEYDPWIPIPRIFIEKVYLKRNQILNKNVKIGGLLVKFLDVAGSGEKRAFKLFYEFECQGNNYSGWTNWVIFYIIEGFGSKSIFL